MTQATRQKRQGKALKGGRLTFLSLFATALFAVPMFFCAKKDDTEEDVKDWRQDTRHSIFVISGMDGRTKEESEALENIYAWIDLKSTEKMLNPESGEGFKGFLGKAPKYSFTPSDSTAIGGSRHDSQQPSATSGKPMIIGEEKTVLTKSINEIVPWKPFWEIDMPDIAASERPEGIIWRSANGRRIANAPEIDEKIARESWNKNVPSGVTTLECSRFLGKMPPRVILRRSCGNPELDMLAVAALRRHLLNAESSSGVGEFVFRQFRTDVLWHLRN
ncbi:MAG: hypothetical protein J5833_01465 [Victivallales bacterium]|nr:hypothetical protein [Victivallales bacterium]